MAINTVITCDICGKQKGDVNHWWLAWCNRRSLEVEPFRLTDSDQDPQHLCGHECVHKALDKFMQGKITEQARLQQKQRDAEASAAFASNSATLQSW